MKLINKTNWNTRQLRSLFQEVAKRELDPDKRKKLRIVVVKARTRFSGCAIVGGNNCTIRIPSKNKTVYPTQGLVASIAAHEMAHCRGLRHERPLRASIAYGWHKDWQQFYAWTKDYPLEYNPKVKKSKGVDADKKVARLLELQSSWNRKLKLAQTKLKKLKVRLKYYAKKGNECVLQKEQAQDKETLT